MDWIIIGLFVVCGVILFMISQGVFGYGITGMMEHSKSRRLVEWGIALALGGPVLICTAFLLSLLCASLGQTWLARSLLIGCAVIFLAWQIAGIVVHVAKVRFAASEHETTVKSEQGK